MKSCGGVTGVPRCQDCLGLGGDCLGQDCLDHWQDWLGEECSRLLRVPIKVWPEALFPFPLIQPVDDL